MCFDIEKIVWDPGIPLRIRPGNRIAKESTLSGNLHLQSSTTKQNICSIRAQKIISLSSLFVLDNFSRTATALILTLEVGEKKEHKEALLFFS